MKICAVVKYPPIQGGVSARTYWQVREWARAGHTVHVVTNAAEVEPEYRLWIPPEEVQALEYSDPHGGAVRVRQTGDLKQWLRHIPASPVYLSRLASVAADVVKAEECDLLYSNYLEPYGLAGHMASLWTGVPHVVHHAGSDRTRLLSHPELNTAYVHVLRDAAAIVTHDDSLLGFGIRPGGLCIPNAFARPFPEESSPAAAKPLQVTELIQRIERLSGHANGARKEFDQSLPTIGVYGKVGTVKGTFHLVRALGQLKKRGIQFNFLSMVGGTDAGTFVDEIVRQDLTDRAFILPFMPHWWIPRFLAACTAACFLEHDFPVEIHAPTIPDEVLACGTCLVISTDIAEKQRFRERLRHEVNAFVVNPRDDRALLQTLTAITTEPDEAQAIGLAGAQLLAGQPGVEALAPFWDRTFSLARSACRAPVEMGRAANTGRIAATPILRFVSSRMPITSWMLQETFSSLVKDWAAARQDWGSHDGRRGIKALERGLYRELRFQRGEDWRATDLLRWEVLRLWLATEDEERPAGVAFPRFAGAARLTGNRVMPVHTDRVRVETFRMAVPDVERQFEAQRVVDWSSIVELTEPASYLFVKRGDLLGRVFEIDARTRALIERSDGSTPLTGIADDLAMTVDDALDRARRLHAEGALLLR